MTTWLLVEDNPIDSTVCIQTLRSSNRSILHAHTLSEATKFWQTTPSIDFVLLDLQLPDGLSLSFLEMVKQHKPKTPVLMMSAYGEIPTVVKAIHMGAIDFLEKPLKTEHLQLTIKQIEQRYIYQSDKTLEQNSCVEIQAKEEYDALLENIIYHPTSPLKQTLELCRLVASKECPIFLRGESGTGKEVLAQYIHSHSQVSRGPLIAVNCGAIPDGLMESQFFGYKKGAFSGASQDNQGYLEAANGGTLFLDEIAELPLPLQSKLLRAIQEHEVCPIGSTTPKQIQFRLISASHKDLKHLVEVGAFREDLYYRIHVFPIYIPPLRDRKMDILPLIEKFLSDHYKTGIQKFLLNFPISAINALWPGNIRQLKNVCDRFIVYNQMGLGWDNALTEDLGTPKQVGFGILDQKMVAVNTPTEYKYVSSLALHRAADPNEILRQLSLNNFNRELTAQALGISRRTLQYRLAKMKA